MTRRVPVLDVDFRSGRAAAFASSFLPRNASKQSPELCQKPRRFATREQAERTVPSLFLPLLQKELISVHSAPSGTSPPIWNAARSAPTIWDALTQPVDCVTPDARTVVDLMTQRVTRVCPGH